MSASAVAAGASGLWSFVIYTSSASALAELGALAQRFPEQRFFAVVPEGTEAPEELLVLGDRGGRLAAQMGVAADATRTFALDGQGTLREVWEGVPEAEVVAGYAERSPMPSAAPVWLFPVLGAVVLLTAVVTWGLTRTPAAPERAPLAPVAVAPAVPVAEEPVAAEVPAVEVPPAEGEAAPVEGAAEGEATPVGKPVRGLVDGWQMMPKGVDAAHATAAGGVVTLNAYADKDVMACREPAAAGTVGAVAAEWKASGVDGKSGARVTARMLDADGKVIKGTNLVLGKLRGTTDWAPMKADVKLPAGAQKVRLCLELAAGAGKVELRNYAQK